MLSGKDQCRAKYACSADTYSYCGDGEGLSGNSWRVRCQRGKARAIKETFIAILAALHGDVRACRVIQTNSRTKHSTRQRVAAALETRTEFDTCDVSLFPDFEIMQMTAADASPRPEPLSSVFSLGTTDVPLMRQRRLNACRGRGGASRVINSSLKEIFNKHYFITRGFTEAREVVFLSITSHPLRLGKALAFLRPRGRTNPAV